MAAVTIQDRFIHTVVNGFINSRKTGNLEPLSWVQDSLFNPEMTQTEVNNFAVGILADFRSSIPRDDSKRYQFRPENPSDALLKVIFEESFHYASQNVIQDAEPIGGSFYPLWKRVCLIYIPKALGVFFENTLVKIVISIATIYYSYKLGNVAVKEIQHTFSARVIPFFINNTPIFVTRSANRILNVIDWINQYKFSLLVGAFAIQKIILLGPNIPYFTAAIRTIDIWNIGLALYRSPQTTFFFFFDKFLEIVKFVRRNSALLAIFFCSIAKSAEEERLVISKAKSYAVWKKVIAEKIPKQRVSKEHKG